MLQENIQMLEDQRPKAEMLLKTGGCRNMRIDALHLIMVQEFDPKYVMKEWDNDSMIKMVHDVYEKYAEWQEKNPA